MNTRSENSVQAGIDMVRFTPMGSWPDPAPEPFLSPYGRPDIESVFEAYSGPNPSHGQKWTNFQHYKRWMAPPGSGEYYLPYVVAWPNTGDRYWSGRFPTYFGWVQHSGLGHVMSTKLLYNPQSDGSFVITPPNIEDLKQRALKSIMPGIRSNMSLINSILELKDFKGEVKAVRRLSKSLWSMVTKLPPDMWVRLPARAITQKWKAYIARLKKMSGGQLASVSARELASNYLQWKFAIAPLISDVAAVRRSLASLEKSVNRIITNEGKVRTGHWSTGQESLSGEIRKSSFNLGPPLNPYLSVTSELTAQTGPAVTTFHCEVRYNYNLLDYQREHARTLSLLDQLGVNVNPAIIWNAIPFSFVVDWVLDVQSFLDQFKLSNMRPVINVLGALWSARYERSTDWEKSHTAPPGVDCTTRISMPRINEEAYIRTLFMPGYSSLLASGLSSSEFTLGAALVIARNRRKARHGTR